MHTTDIRGHTSTLSTYLMCVSDIGYGLAGRETTPPPFPSRPPSFPGLPEPLHRLRPAHVVISGHLGPFSCRGAPAEPTQFG